MLPGALNEVKTVKTKRVSTWLVAGSWLAAAHVAWGVEPTPRATEPRGLTWEQQIGDEAGDSAAQALAWSEADGNIVVAGFSTPPAGGAPGSGSFWLRRLDGSGELRQTVRIPFERGQGPVARARRYIGGLVLLPGGDALVVVEMGQSRPVLVRVSARGEVLFSKPLSAHSTSVTRLVAAEQGRYLLVGRQGDDAFAMKVDADGQPIWTQRFDRGESEIFTDVVPTQNGGFVAAGGTRVEHPAKDERVWVVRANAEGVRQADTTFPGRHGVLALAPDGTLRVAYDGQTESFAHDVRVATLDTALRTTATASLLERDAGFPARLGIVAHPHGGFLVAGVKGLGLWLQRIDAQDGPTWSWSDAPTRGPKGRESRAWHQWFEAFAAARDAVFVLTSVQRVDPTTNRSEVGLMRLGEP